MFNWDSATWLHIGEKLGVPAFVCALLMAMMHFDFALPMQRGIDRGIDFQKEAVQKLTKIETSQIGMEYDLRYGTWRSTEAPKPGVVDPNPPPPPTRGPSK